MRAYHSEETVEVQLHELMLDEAFLHSKGLYKQWEKVLQKAKQLAIDYELFPTLVTILTREKQNLLDNPSGDLKAANRESLREIRKVLDKMINEYEYLRLYDNIFTSYRENANIKDQKVFNALRDLLNTPLLQDLRKARCFTARKYFHLIHAVYHRLMGEWEPWRQHCKKIVELYEQHPERIKLDSVKYKVNLANYLVSCYYCSKYEEYEPMLEKIKALPRHSEYAESVIFKDVYHLELLYYLNTGQLEKAEQLVPEITRGLCKYSKNISKARELAFYYNICILYFLKSDFDESLEWLERLLADKTDVRKDQKLFGRLLQLILHFEIGNTMILDSLVRSAYRYLLKRKRVYSYERSLINFFKKAPYATSQRQWKDHCRDLQQKLADLKQDPNAKNSVGIDELSIWLESKIAGQPLSELLQQTSSVE